MPLPTKWDLTELFSGDDDPAIKQARRRADRATAALVKQWSGRTDYLSEPLALAELLGEYEEWLDGEANYASEAYYFGSRRNLQLTNDVLQERTAAVEQVGVKLSNDLRFITHSLATIPAADQRRLLKAPELAPYRTFLRELFDWGQYQLSVETENMLSRLRQPAYEQWVDLTERLIYRATAPLSDDDGEVKERPYSEATGLIGSSKAEVRGAAAQMMADVHRQNATVATAELNAILLNKQIEDEARGLTRPDEARIIRDQVSTKMIDSLIDSVGQFNHVPRDFYKLKAKYLGVKRLPYHDRSYNPLPMPDTEYSYSEGVKLVRDTLNGLDGQFGHIFDGLVENGQVDVYPRAGKRGGAYCSYGLRRHPILILLNYTKKIRDVRTFAHETGHAINFELMRAQRPFYFGVSMAMAETASTFFEDYVIEELIKRHDSPELRRYLLFEKVSDEVATIHRQIALYRFEQELHVKFRAQGRVSQDEIGEIFARQMAEYMGPAVEQGEIAEQWWVGWPHIRNFFYVYSYASGLLISKILQSRVQEDPSYIKEVKWLLGVGQSLTTLDAMRKLDIDLESGTTWEIGLNEMAADLKRLTDQL